MEIMERRLSLPQILRGKEKINPPSFPVIGPSRRFREFGTLIL